MKSMCLKQLFFFILYTFLQQHIYSQSQNWWKLDGNSNGSSTSFIGTTNNAALRFRANNTEWFSISSAGQYTFNGLSGTGNGLMLISNTGNVYRLNFSGNANEVLTAAGTWQSISNLSPQYWQLSNNTLISNYNVGIGTNIVPEKLTVNGNILANGSISGTSLNVVDITTTGREFKVSNTLCIKGYDPQDPTSRNHICGTTNDLYIQSTSGNHNTIINDGNQGRVGIGTNTPITTLDVNGSARFSDRLYVSRILAQPGDSLIAFGDSTIWMNNNLNCIYGTGNIQRGIALGFPNFPKGFNSICMGSNTEVDVNTFYSIVIGRGTINGSNRLINNIPNSLMVGFNSNIPTLFVGESDGVNTTGKVGVGTANPKEKLQIGDEFVFHDGGSKVIARNFYYDGTDKRIKQGAASAIYFGNGEISFRVASSGSANSNIIWTEAFSINNNGSISKLNVCGIIKAKEVVVQTGWCDFVFEKDYKLMTLKERENYILKNKRLPYMMSAAKVDENGANVAEALTGILQNTEEITLYLIELNKKIEILQEENKVLKNKVEKLKQLNDE